MIQTDHAWGEQVLASYAVARVSRRPAVVCAFGFATGALAALAGFFCLPPA